jgi:hypothetical protein
MLKECTKEIDLLNGELESRMKPNNSTQIHNLYRNITSSFHLLNENWEFVELLILTIGCLKWIHKTLVFKSDKGLEKTWCLNSCLSPLPLNFNVTSVHHYHLAKYKAIPESWRSKNYAFEFVECIKSVIGKILWMLKSLFHTLIVDESIAFYCLQYL